MVIYSNYFCHLHRFLYHAQWNIFFTIPDDAEDRRKLGIKRITVAQGLNPIVYLINMLLKDNSKRLLFADCLAFLKKTK